MVDKNRNDSSGKNEELLSGNNVLNKFQIFLDNNIRVIRNVVWIIGGIGIVVIIRRTYAVSAMGRSTVTIAGTRIMVEVMQM